MMRAKHTPAIIAAIGDISCGSTARASPFAIACTGTAQFTDKIGEEREVRNYPLPEQIYVFDEDAKRAQRALIPRQQFEDVCFRGGYIDNVKFTPGLIIVRSEKQDQLCDFEVNRKTGDGEYFSHADFSADHYNEIQFKMTCSRTEVPVFDSSKNKF